MVKGNRRGVYEVRPVRTSAHKISEAEAAQRFASVVLPFSTKQLQRASDKTTDAVRSWKCERRCPHLASVINLARELPAVKAWLYSEIESGGPEFDDPHTVNAVMRAIDKLPPEAARRLMQKASEP